MARMNRFEAKATVEGEARQAGNQRLGPAAAIDAGGLTPGALMKLTRRTRLRRLCSSRNSTIFGTRK